MQWIESDNGLRETIQAITRESRDAGDMAAFQLDLLNCVYDLKPDLRTSFYGDLLNQAIAKIDFAEVMDELLELME